jgi:hypothetical protein
VVLALEGGRVNGWKGFLIASPKSIMRVAGSGSAAAVVKLAPFGWMRRQLVVGNTFLFPRAFSSKAHKANLSFCTSLDSNFLCAFVGWRE